MIITCPNCSTRYSLPQDKIKPGGQKVRCAKCGTAWFQVAEDEPLTLTATEQVPAQPEPAWSAAAVAPAEAAPAATPVASAPNAAPEPVPAPAEAPSPESRVEPQPTEAAAAKPTAEGFAEFRMASGEPEKPGKGRAIAIAVIVLVVVALGALVAFKQQVQELTGIRLMPDPSTEVAAAPPPVAVAMPAPPIETNRDMGDGC